MRPIVPDVSGLVLLNKEPGLTSFQALYPVKRVYGNSVGHTGTLDKFAQGLLVVLVGKFTKFNGWFTAFDKVYEADFTFGVETDTLDPEGAVVFQGSDPDDSVVSFAGQWVGLQMQVPPSYSAVHVNGRRASERIRDGQTLTLEPRPITVYSLEILGWAPPVLTVRIHCSKGTYVRALARDWGRASGFGAHVTRLVRTRVGPFELPSAGQTFLAAPASLDALDVPLVRVPPESVAAVLNGRDPEAFVPALADTTANRVGLQGPDHSLLAVVERESRWKYLFVDRGSIS